MTPTYDTDFCGNVTDFAAAPRDSEKTIRIKSTRPVGNQFVVRSGVEENE